MKLNQFVRARLWLQNVWKRSHRRHNAATRVTVAIALNLREQGYRARLGHVQHSCLTTKFVVTILFTFVVRAFLYLEQENRDLSGLPFWF
jgi:hypothetical protein